MSVGKPITIIGGGLAGLALGIGLRRKGVPVTLWEAGKYPRHRVCGEFVSGSGQEVLARLGSRERLAAAGGTPARTAVFFVGKARTPARAIEPAALCVSRYRMDALLAEQFVEAGGELRPEQRWPGREFGEGVVRASGRRLQPAKDEEQWVGLKIHARNVTLATDFEMHGSPRSYVGICKFQDGTVNVCGLFRRQAAAPAAGRPRYAPLCGVPGSVLHERLKSAVFDESSFCAVAGFSLRAYRAADRPECCIGDALTMIPPVTGNGMSMALESAELAVAPLAAYSLGETSWDQARRAVGQACSQAFARRLAWARLLQWLMFTPLLRGPLAQAVLGSEWVWRVMFTKTR